MRTKLVLQDKTIFEGFSFGAKKSSAGEVVFSTAMTGYVEALTDPSFAGQILVLTYPLIGNYGVPDPKYFQSEKIQVSGLIVSQFCQTPNHYQNKQTLDAWLKQNNVPGLSEIDTRVLTQKIRQSGTMLGKIQFENQKIDFYDPNKENIVAKVSLKKPQIFHSDKGRKTICLIDCGYKKAILESLLARQINIIVVPWNFNPFNTSLPQKISGMIISNGPGDPKVVTETIATVRQAIENKVPILGICLGNQILALAAGGKTYKLKFGHRSLNQPVQDLFTKRCFITSQNHGFSVHNEGLPKDWQPWFVNLNDQTNEGIISKNKMFFGVQFHPEGHPGPEDTGWVFDEFINKLV